MAMRDFRATLAKELQDDEERMGYGEAAAQMGFAIALSLARHERNMTQQELADLLGVSKAYVVRLESGEANPSIAKAGRIFAALWLKPIDRPFPLLKGYGPGDAAAGPAAPETLPATPEKLSRDIWPDDDERVAPDAPEKSARKVTR